MDELAGRVAVVTGGGSGIGAGIVRALAGAGMDVVVADLDLVAAQSVAAAAGVLGVAALAVRTDVSDRAEVLALRDRALERFGAVHVVCNNAGVSVLRRGVDANHADWQWVIGVNLWGVVHGMEAFLPVMLASGQPGHIVNTASMNGLFPSGRSAMYSASKYAVVGLSETFRNELVDTQVRMSVLCPGAVTTRIDSSERNRPLHLAAPSGAPPFTASSEFELSTPREPDEVGAMVRDAIRTGQFYIFTDAAVRTYLEARHADLLRDLDRTPAGRGD